MKDGEAIGGDRGAGSSCPNCGRGLTNQARFCGYCGAQVPPVESMSEARLVLAMVAAWQAWKRGRMYQIHRIGGYLLPLPVAILLLIAGSSYTLRLRFDLSEEALHDRVQRFERGDTVSPGGSELVGLYTVESIYHRNDCVVLETNSGIDM